MPWVVKEPKVEGAAAEEGEKAPKKEKGEGKAGKAKGFEKGGDKGGKKGGDKGKGKGDREDYGWGRRDEEKGGWGRDDDKGKGKKGKGKGKEEDTWGKGKGKGGKGKFEDEGFKGFKGDSKGGKKGGKDGGGKGKHVADDDAEKPERPARNEDMRRQASALTGAHCTVRKHSSMGCAVISMVSVQTRQAILQAGLKLEISGHTLTIRPHSDKDTKQEIMTDIFAGWGRQAEKNEPLSEQELASYFDEKHIELTSTGRITAQGGAGGGGRALSEEEKRANAMKTAAAQAQWAAAGGAPGAPRAPMPVGPAPGAGPGAVAPGAQNPQLLQQQQAQYMAAMQAQHMMRVQQQQYYMAMQAQQQQQQQAWMAHLKTQQEAQANAQNARVNRKSGYKASYRVPTDDEVAATLMRLSAKPAGGEADGAEALPADAIPTAEAEAEAPAAA